MMPDKNQNRRGQAKGWLAQTAGLGKKVICCLDDDEQALKCAQELESAAALVRGRYPLPQG